MLEKALYGGKRYWALLTFLGLLIAAGVITFLVQLTKGLTITGRVTLESLGDPVEGALLWGHQHLDRSKSPLLGSRNRKAKTLGDGTFTLAGFGPGKVYVAVSLDRKQSYRPVRGVTVEAGARDVELHVVSVGHVAFKAVEESTGEPVLFPIHATLQGDKKYYSVVRVTKDGPGRFVLLCPAGARKRAFAELGAAREVARCDRGRGAACAGAAGEGRSD